ncbi:MAG: hypothetical protein ACJAVK_002396 [Akkermansiaceae bacterium]|jgi:hypothetical protein
MVFQQASVPDPAILILAIPMLTDRLLKVGGFTVGPAEIVAPLPLFRLSSLRNYGVAFDIQFYGTETFCSVVKTRVKHCTYASNEGRPLDSALAR